MSNYTSNFGVSCSTESGLTLHRHSTLVAQWGFSDLSPAPLPRRLRVYLSQLFLTLVFFAFYHLFVDHVSAHSDTSEVWSVA